LPARRGRRATPGSLKPGRLAPRWSPRYDSSWGEFDGWPPETIRSIAAPAHVIVADSDVIRPKQAVEIVRLRGGGVPGDLAGLPRSRLAVLPGTTHVTLVDRADWLTSMVTEFLDEPMPDAK
jgi:pimeloyl-ACP methyl ester carboxylesterase